MSFAKSGLALVALVAAATPALAEPMRIEVQNATGGTIYVSIGQTNASLAQGQIKQTDETNTTVGIQVRAPDQNGSILCNGSASYQMIATATATFPTCTLNINSARPDTQCLKSTQNSTAPTCYVQVIVAGP
ncbi:MAG: hypothetical protein AB7O45_16895 [Alphaproteobacteria bacterium]